MRSAVRSSARVGFALAIVFAIALPAAGAASSSQPQPLGKLKVSIRFTKNRYAPGDKAHIDVTLRNTGSVRLRRVGAACDRVGDPDELNNAGRNWGALAARAHGVSVRAHHEHTFHVVAKVPAAAQRAGQVVIACDFGRAGNDSGYRPRALDSAKVPGQSGALSASFIYFRHGRSGKTAGLAHVRAVLVDTSRCPLYTRSTTSGKHSRLRIGHVPAGSSYTVYFRAPKGWKVRDENPINAEVFGRTTSRLVVVMQRGSAHTPHVPTKCS